MGYINDDYSSSGRIDIVIDPVFGSPIIVENKIYAGDQENQLFRYRNHYPNAHILYLTLDGSTPAASSIGNMVIDNDFHTGSYKKDILKWLEICRMESS